MKGEDNTVADALSRLPYDLLELSAASTDTPTLSSMYIQDDEMITACIGAVLSVGKDMPFSAAFLLSHGPVPTPIASLMPTELSTSIDETTITEIKAAYIANSWCKNLITASQGMTALTFQDSLWFIGSWLMVPQYGTVCKKVF